MILNKYLGKKKEKRKKPDAFIAVLQKLHHGKTSPHGLTLPKDLYLLLK